MEHNMNAIRLTVIIALTISAQTAAFASPVSIKGNWVTKDKDAVITIAQCGAALCGSIARYLVTPPNGIDQRDVNNTDKSKRGRKLLGSNILTNFTPSGNEYKGTIYDPRNGKSYRSVVYKGKSGNLVVKGCLGPFCQSQTWTPAR
jgi:uncharacterized protein (DUF2147 family)